MTPLNASAPANDHDNRYPSVKFPGPGSQGGPHYSKARFSREPVNHGATSPKSIHLNYKQPPLPSADAPTPYPFYNERHSDEKNLPMLAAQIESALENDDVGSNAPPYRAPPRRKPILKSKSDFPPFPHNEIYSEKEVPSPSGEVPPFADPRYEPPLNLRPGLVDVRQSIHSIRF